MFNTRWSIWMSLVIPLTNFESKCSSSHDLRRHNDQGYRTFMDEGLSHPVRQPGPTEVVLKTEGNANG